MNIVIYFAIASVSFAANFAAFTGVVYVLGLHWLVANLAGFVAGTLTNYVLCIRFVFASRIHARRSTEVFMVTAVSTVGVGLETFLIYVGHDLLGAMLAVAKIVAAGVVFFWNYLARRYLVFGGTKSATRSVPRGIGG
ncbi:MAG: GtrA family protein [Reyranellales bacterium]